VKHENATLMAARRLRKRKAMTDRDRVLLRAGEKLRRVRGLYRDRYSSEEVELVATARLLAFSNGQLRLARFLTLRRRGRRRKSIEPASSLHECPKCGRWHKEPHRAPTKATIAEERKAIQKALEEAK
jgi:ribosomal protein L32